MRAPTLALLMMATAVAVSTPTVSSAQTSTNNSLTLDLECEGGGLTSSMNGYDGYLYVHLRGERGEAKLPRQIIGTFKSPDTLFPLSDVVITRDKITAKYRPAPLSSARLEIDRVHGGIRTIGSPATFIGTCAPYDPGSVRNAF